MTYRVALDDKSGGALGRWLKRGWSRPTGRYPSAFLWTKRYCRVDEHRWVKEATLVAVLDGKFDVHKAAAAYDQEQKTSRRCKRVEEGN